jgi:hypothetical protein
LQATIGHDADCVPTTPGWPRSAQPRAARDKHHEQAGAPAGRPALISPPDQRLVTLAEDSKCTHCCAAGTAALRPGSAEWLRLARRARRLSWISLGWLGIEGGIAILTAILTGSVALCRQRLKTDPVSPPEF